MPQVFHALVIMNLLFVSGAWCLARPSRAAAVVVLDEGVDVEQIDPLIDQLVTRLESDDGLPGLVKAAMAHLNLVLIHPFHDGNGRMARCLQTLVLAREGVISPEFSSIEEYLGHNTDAYYGVLAQVGGGSWPP